MKGNLKQALENTNTMYSELVEIANGIIKQCTGELDSIIDNAVKNITASGITLTKSGDTYSGTTTFDKTSTTLNAEVENRTGSWKRNKLSYDSYDKSIQDILTITVNRVDDSYAYSIQTESKKDKVFNLVCNTNKIQAIELPSVDKEIAVACYEPGEFEYEGDTYNITQVGYQVIEKKRH